ncbi:MAG: hypothetical protein AAFQ94_15370 [Bacteroidota bacterium]
MKKNTKTPANNRVYIPEESKRHYAFSIWLGAFIRWITAAGTRKFNDLYHSSENSKNLIIGYLVTLILISVLITVFIYYR